MLTLYLVRHGQTDYSRQNRFCGALDPPLNTVGREMAEALAARLVHERWAAIYTSPLLRARQTAQPTVDRVGLPLLVEDGLREIAYGEWEGRLEADVQAADAERFFAWADHPGRVAPPGGETGEQIARRAQAALQSFQSRSPEGHVLVVSHKATLRVLLCTLLGIDVDLFRRRIAQKVCALSVVELRATGPFLLTLGDDTHLPPHLRASLGT